MLDREQTLINKENMKDKIAERISYLLPDRVVLWVIVRAFAYTTTHECSHKMPDECGYIDVYKSWEKKFLLKKKGIIFNMKKYITKEHE